MKNHRVDGMLISVAKNTANYEHFDLLQDYNIPLVFFDRIPKKTNIHYVACNVERGMEDAINFLVKLGDSGGEDQIVGGFSDMSGLGNEIKYSEYRNGNDPDNHVRKVPNINSTDDVTLKRGVIGELRLYNWLKDTREGVYDPRTVTITLFDEARVEVCSWVLTSAQPKKWTGPTLAAKGGGEVAMEELQLVAEKIEYKSS